MKLACQLESRAKRSASASASAALRPRPASEHSAARLSPALVFQHSRHVRLQKWQSKIEKKKKRTQKIKSKLLKLSAALQERVYEFEFDKRDKARMT